MKEYLSPRVCPNPPSRDDQEEEHTGIDIPPLPVDEEVMFDELDNIQVPISEQEADIIREAARVTNTPTGGVVQSDFDIESKLRNGKGNTSLILGKDVE